MGKLPFETKRKILVKKEAVTDEKYKRTDNLFEYGIVNIDKPSGPTSHQVSHYVKEILKLAPPTASDKN